MDHIEDLQTRIPDLENTIKDDQTKQLIQNNFGLIDNLTSQILDLRKRISNLENRNKHY